VLARNDEGKLIGIAETYFAKPKELPELVVGQLEYAPYGSEFEKHLEKIKTALSGTDFLELMLYFVEIVIDPAYRETSAFKDLVEPVAEKNDIHMNDTESCGLIIVTSQDAQIIYNMVGSLQSTKLLYKLNNSEYGVYHVKNRTEFRHLLDM